MVDLVSHVLWAYAVFHHQPDAYLYAAFSLLPDAIWALPSVLALLASGKVVENIRGMRSSRRPDRFKHMQGQPHFVSIKWLYNAAHSWFLVGLAALAIGFLWPKMGLPFAGGVFLHLALDLFLHKESPFGQYPFFPISAYKVDGFIHWSDKRVLAANFAILAVVYGLILSGHI